MTASDRRRELRERARALGVQRQPGTSDVELAHRIEQVERLRRTGGARLPQRLVTFRKTGQSRKIAVQNFGQKPRTLRVEVLSRDEAFTVRSDELVVEAGATVQVPVRFREQGAGAALTRAHVFGGVLRISDPELGRVLDTVDLRGTGIGRVPVGDVACLYDPAPPPAPYKGNSPPVVTLTVEPQIVWPGETVRVTWSVTGATSVYEGSSRPSSEVLPPGVFTDAGGDAGPTTARSASYDAVISRTTTFTVSAGNAEGTTSARETAYLKVRIGYHDAATPAGGIPETDLTGLRRDLEDVDRRLAAGCIRNNTNLDRFADPYLRGALTDDILRAMRTVLIVTGRHQLPSRYRATSRLCERIGAGAVYGQVPSDRSFLSLCRELGADELTLLHELYHYAATHDPGSEPKAFAISACDPVTGRGGCYLTDAECGA